VAVLAGGARPWWGWHPAEGPQLLAVEIIIPDDVAARIQIDGGLSLIEVDRGRFPQEGDYFQSPDFESAANRVEMVIECDIGRVVVK